MLGFPSHECAVQNRYEHERAAGHASGLYANVPVFVVCEATVEPVFWAQHNREEIPHALREHNPPLESGAFRSSPIATLWTFEADKLGKVPESGVGYRIVDREKLKVDARAELRYWHLGQNLSFQPSGILNNFSLSATG